MERIKSIKDNCEKCDALCCKVLEIDEMEKKGGVPCEHLQGDGTCKIHPTIKGYDSRPSICGGYSCLGAGEIATEMFEGRDLNDKKLSKIRDIVFTTLQVYTCDIRAIEEYLEAHKESHDVSSMLDKYHSNRGLYIKGFKEMLEYDHPIQHFVDLSDSYVDNMNKLLADLFVRDMKLYAAINGH